MDTSIDSNSCPSIDSTLFDAMLENCCLSDNELSQEIMQIEEYINSCDHICADRHKQTDGSVVPVVRPIATYNKCLNDIELNRLQELSTAVKCLHCLVCPSTQHIIEYPTLEEYYTNSVSINIRGRQGGGGIAKIPLPEIENFQNTPPLSFEIFRRPPP